MPCLHYDLLRVARHKHNNELSHSCMKTKLTNLSDTLMTGCSHIPNSLPQSVTYK